MGESSDATQEIEKRQGASQVIFNRKNARPEGWRIEEEGRGPFPHIEAPLEASQAYKEAVFMSDSNTLPTAIKMIEVAKNNVLGFILGWIVGRGMLSVLVNDLAGVV